MALFGHVQSTYLTTYHYVNERSGTQAYVNAAFYYAHGFPLQNVNFFKLFKNHFTPRNANGKGHFHLRNAAFVYVTPLFSTYWYVIIHFLLRGETYESVSLFSASVTGVLRYGTYQYVKTE